MLTICLTATAYEGADDGLERRVLDEMGYKIYNNSNKNEDFNPVIHESREIGNLESYRSLIQKESEKCGVLVYATE